VRDYLIEKGINASRLTAVGYGESRPVASNDTAAGRQENRRVELVVLDR
jgi:OOP family OmpA-OmpF porin